MTPHYEASDHKQLSAYDEIEGNARLTLAARALEDRSLLTAIQVMQNCLAVVKSTKFDEVNKKIEDEKNAATPDASLVALRAKQSEQLATLLSSHELEMVEATSSLRYYLNSASEELRQEFSDLSEWILDNEEEIQQHFEEKKEKIQQRRDLEDERLAGELLRVVKQKIDQTSSSKTLPKLTPSPKISTRMRTPLKIEKRKHKGQDAENHDSPSVYPPKSPIRSSPTSAKRQKTDLFSRRGDILSDHADPGRSPATDPNKTLTGPQIQQRFAKLQQGGLAKSPAVTPTRQPSSSSSWTGGRGRSSSTFEPDVFDIFAIQPAETSFEVRYIRFVKLDNEPSIWNESNNQTLNLELQNDEFKPSTKGHKRKWHLSEWLISPSRVWSIKTNVSKSLVQINRRKEGKAKAELWVGFRDSKAFSAFIEVYKAKWPGTLIEEKPGLECPKMFVRSRDGEWK